MVTSARNGLHSVRLEEGDYIWGVAVIAVAVAKAPKVATTPAVESAIFCECW